MESFIKLRPKRGELRLFLSPRSMAVYPPWHETTIDAHPEFPLFFTFRFHGINIDFRVMTKRCRIEIREFECIIKGHENVSMYV